MTDLEIAWTEADLLFLQYRNCAPMDENLAFMAWQSAVKHAEALGPRPRPNP